MGVESQKYLIQNMERIIFSDLSDNSLLFVAEDLQSATMTNEQETVYATGKNGVRIGAADRNKQSNIEITNGTITDGAIAAAVGSEVEVGKHTIPNYFEILTVATETNVQTATTTYKAVGPTGKEIAYIYKRNSDGTQGDKYPIAAAASESAFKYDPATCKITCPTGKFTAGDQLIVIYDMEATGSKKISNFENKYSKTGKLVADIWAKDICTDKSYFGKIVYYKAKAQGNFNLAFGNDPSVQTMTFDALSGGCGSANNVLWDIFIFDEDDGVKA